MLRLRCATPGTNGTYLLRFPAFALSVAARAAKSKDIAAPHSFNVDLLLRHSGSGAQMYEFLMV